MKKLTLSKKAFSKGNALTRNDLKKITGGVVPPEGGDNCFQSYFMIKAEGCGIYHCFGIDTTPPLPPPGSHNCSCVFELQAAHPCGFA